MNVRVEAVRSELLTYIVGLLALALLMLFLDLRDEVPGGPRIGLLPGGGAAVVSAPISGHDGAAHRL